MAVVGVLALCGALMTTSARESAGTQLRSEVSTLPEVVQERGEEADTLQQEVDAARLRVEALRDSAGEGDDTVRAANDALEDAREGASAAEVTGDGLEVVLDDAPRSAMDTYEGVEANDLLIHQQDVEAVMNALWAGGATGMTVQDQRLVSTSSVQCVGNTLRVNGRVFSPPYSIRAVGDPVALREALDASPQIATYLEYVDLLGLGWTVREGETTLPAYDGVPRVELAQVKE